jgi:biotin carboxyl carrier protein
LKLKITVDGHVYEVDVEVSEPEPLQPAYVPPAGQTRIPAAVPGTPPPARPGGAPAPAADESKVCRSPFAGTVSRVAAQVGQTIQVNDVLMVLEAMKMETVITAPIAGTVAKINVAAGDPVQQGQILVEFE